MRYLPLMAQSAFSFLYGSFQPEELVEAVRARGGAGACLCDQDGLYGMVRLRRAAQAVKLYTLCGARLSILGGGSLVFYPQDESGHASLCRLITRAQLENPRGKPALHPEWLSQAANLVGLIPGRDMLAQGIFWLAGLRSFFKGPLFMGLSGAEISPAERGQLRIWAEQAGAPALAAPEIVALDEAGHKIHRDLVGIAQAIHHRTLEPLPAGAGVLPGDAWMARYFTPQEIKRTWQIADLCPWQLPLGRRFFALLSPAPGQRRGPGTGLALHAGPGPQAQGGGFGSRGPALKGTEGHLQVRLFGLFPLGERYRGICPRAGHPLHGAGLRGRLHRDLAFVRRGGPGGA